MSILALQRQYNELYRIRLGEKSGDYPTSLNHELRVTSGNQDVIKAFTSVYGGRHRKWSDGPKLLGYQAKLPIDRLPIILLPGQNLSQHMELWRGSVCDRRCDGFTMSKKDGKPSDAVCACGPDRAIANRQCKPVTRLTVACPEVAAVGVGLLTTRSVIAAGEMKGQLDLAQPILDQGRAVSAILRLDRLTGTDKVFNVPRLELVNLTFAELAAANHPAQLAPAPAAALTQGEANAQPAQAE